MKTDKLISLKPMTVATLKVLRVNDFGAFLNAGTGNSDDDILLHKTQQTDEVKVGDTVNVFLYLDPKKRLTASMRVPKMREGQIARLKVINVTNDLTWEPNAEFLCLLPKWSGVLKSVMLFGQNFIPISPADWLRQ